MNRTALKWVLTLTCTLYLSTVALAGVVVDPALPDYAPKGQVSGSIKSIGSDTMNNEMALWAEGFRAFHSGVKVEVEGKGSSTAPPALIAGTSNFGPMSRKMKSQEVDAFEKKFGYKPVQLRTSIDMLAVYVHKDNPIKGLTLQQVDAIFSKTRKGGYPQDIRTWGDLGLTGEWQDKPISIYGRNSASGTYGYFKKHALFKGDYKDEVKEQPGSSSVVQGVASDKYGIGYSGIGYRTSDVMVVPLSSETGSDAEFVPAEPENAYSGEYPLARFLYLAVNAKPGSKLDDLRAEFVRFVFSKQGQEVVIKDGYLPVPAAVAREELAAVNITPGS
ncbi:phosphate-binding protein [bacterium CG17_big_fil_post_rev_8_21_14_2_50_64_8]|nr:MAG: phosphate-binding protein [bacterium CG17_big_fil_post_rev_8_21_14_2_50_64_8]PJA74319.1 MAG: phosphate-binding protein [bacterium CG_4_9_14_3_um_filter_65_15]